jgi:hypothetical protein
MTRIEWEGVGKRHCLQCSFESVAFDLSPKPPQVRLRPKKLACSVTGGAVCLKSSKVTNAVNSGHLRQISIFWGKDRCYGSLTDGQTRLTSSGALPVPYHASNRQVVSAVPCHHRPLSSASSFVNHREEGPLPVCDTPDSYLRCKVSLQTENCTWD